MPFIVNRRGLLALTAAAAASTVDAQASSRAGRDEAGRTLPKSNQPVVEIGTGRVRGIEQAGVRNFKGIPYGASTAGHNRFQPPQPVEPWAGVRDTLVYGARCPFVLDATLAARPYAVHQEDAFLLYRNYLPQTAHEDCLRLNVWAPTGTGKRPVMVYMHGGGFFGGSGNDLLAYDGENLARRGDVVVVTHNHRLNLFGYLDLSRFGGRWSQSSNVGMQDIVAVLKWVQANIGAFGGDPGNVTIFGQSGGGGKVLTLMAMPMAKGLFHRAIVQSGAGSPAGTAADAEKVAQQVLANLGISPTDLDQLADLPLEKLCMAAVSRGTGWRPVVDGVVVPNAPAERETLAPGVPLLVGTNLNELKNAVDDPKSATYDDTDLAEAARKKFGDASTDIVAAYKEAHPRRAPIEIWYAMEAADMRRHAFELADKKYALDSKAWQYLFTWATPMLEGRPKTFHSAEIAFVFDNAGLCANQTGGGSAALHLAGLMSNSWTAFARRGDPGHADLPKWPPFATAHPTMLFDAPCRLEMDPEAAALELMTRVAVK